MMLFKLAFYLGMSSVTFAQGTVWQEKMRAVSTALSEVAPYLYPTADKDVKGLTEKVQRLNEASKKLDIKNDHMLKTGDSDPGLELLSNSFQEDVARANIALREGHVDYARYILKGSTAYCIACHTRSSSGAQFPLLKAFSEPLKSAPWVDKMEFQTASRQYDSVYDQVIEQLQKKKCDPISTLDLERGVRLALSISVRVKQDPEKTLKLCREVRSSKCSSLPMKEAAKDWERETQAWKQEKAKKFDNALDMIEEGRRLLKKADLSPSQGHDEVYFLRATALLHDLLKRYPSSREMPEALYLIGVSYSPLQELGLWTLQEKYFMACILKAPHTELAEKCFNRFEQSIVLGYSGSSGTHIPSEVQRQLQELKNKAQRPKEKI